MFFILIILPWLEKTVDYSRRSFVLLYSYKFSDSKSYKDTRKQKEMTELALFDILRAGQFWKGSTMQMYDFMLNLVTTLLGVVIGGFIAIKSSNITNSRLLRKEHLLNLLQKIKMSLDSWSEHVLLDGTNVYECIDVSNLKMYTLSSDLRTAIVYFNTNIAVLKKFKTDFELLRKEDINIQLKAANLKIVLLGLAEKYSEKNIEKLYEQEECSRIIEDYTKRLFNLHTQITTLIANIDEYIDNELLN